jgi:Flp pilus assembly protein CpaB
MPPSRVPPGLRRLRRRVLLHRRGLAALLAALAVLLAVRAATAPPPALHAVLVAAGDLQGGSVLSERDVRLAQVPAGSAPEGVATAAEEVVGRVLAAPLRAGEPVTDVRLVGPGLLAGYPGAVLAPVRVADAGAVGLLDVGDVVDVVATSPETGRAGVVARRVPVVALPRTAATGAGAGPELQSGRLVVLAVDERTALALAEGTVASVLSVVLTGAHNPVP